MMQPSQIMEYATALHSAHGDRAEAEAAAHQREAANKGSEHRAEDWRAIRAAIRQFRGPNES
jgi:hypothetical protein